jgi:uncharacterized ferritin-like protein (DUF455 family)
VALDKAARRVQNGVAVSSETLPPPEGTIERWAWDYLVTTDLEHKLAPPPPPATWLEPARRWLVSRPGRPPQLQARTERKKATKPGAMKDPAKRAEVLHTFLHHELQAAELFCWALLAFPETPLSFRKGLLGICRDELRHIGLYRARIEALGVPFGSVPIKDFFWDRVPGESMTPTHFVARLGVGFEGGNLDHGARFTEYFRAAGDDQAADIQAQITKEEEPHVAFAIHWFKVFTGGFEFDQWRAFLPVPITPSMTRGAPVNVEARRRAGFSDTFLDALATWGTNDDEA